MKVARNRVVQFHYTLTDDAGETLDTSRERDQPMTYLHGAGNIIRGLESAMEGRAVGDSFQVTVPPGEGYGERREANVQRVALKKLGARPQQLKPGMVLNVQTNQGPARVTVLKVGRFNVDVDANHPLSGKSLHFDVEVVEVREATDEERKHGHAHGSGPGAYSHD